MAERAREEAVLAEWAGALGERQAGVRQALAEPGGAARWQILRHLLRPDDPFPLHRALFALAYEGEPPGPRPAWFPDPGAHHNLSSLLDERGFAGLHRWSVEDPEGYWTMILQRLDVRFHRPPTAILDTSGGVEQARWLLNARLNAALSCFEGRDPDALALVAQSETGSWRRQTCGELRQASVQVGRCLLAAGFKPGDAIGVAMPMIAESISIYLGIVLMGGVVVSIADSFAPGEIATRLRIANAAGVFTQDVVRRGGRSHPLYARVVAADAPRAIVLPAGPLLEERLREGDLAWADFRAADPGGDFTPHLAWAEDATNILFSSGTTGEPKAIPWTHVTPVKAAADAFAHHDIQPGDVVAWPTNLGWMMGPWLIYAALVNRAAVALYEGAPSTRGFTTFVQDARVTMLGVVPSLVKTWRAEGAVEGLDWSSIRCFSSTGEASSPEDMLWLMSRAPGYRPVVEYCGGTEIGGGYITGSLLQPQAPAAFSTPAMGCRFLILDDSGQPSDEGELALVPPMLGSSNRLLNRDHHTVYFAGMPLGPGGEVLRRHGDQVRHLGGGYYRAMGRVDDTMNLGGIKVSSAEIERACAGAPGVHEVAAIAIEPAGGGPSELTLVVVPGAPAPDADALQASLQQAIRAQLNPLFKVCHLFLVEALPRTASNKVMRRELRKRFQPA